MDLVTTYMTALEAAPDAPILESGERRVDRAKLLLESARIAAQLQQSGLGRGDVALLALANGPEFLILYLALLRRGAAVVLLSAKAGADELGAVWAAAAARCCFTNSAFVRRVGAAMPDLSARPLTVLDRGVQCLEPAPGRPTPAPDPVFAHASLVKYSSGSLGTPKGIPLSEDNLLAEIENVATTLQIAPGDRILCSIPFSHSYGFDLGVLQALARGATLVWHDAFVPRRTLRELTSARISVYLGVPSTYRFLLDSPGAESARPQARHLLSCTAPLHPELIEEFHRRFAATICQHYGSSETGGATVQSPGEVLRRPESVGRPLHGVRIEIVDAEGRAVPHGVEGEVVIHSRAVAAQYAPGYRPDPNPFGEGSFRSGDLGLLDEDGFLYLRGRKDDMINVGGFKVAPLEVARALEAFAPVAEAAVVGVRDARGETFVYAVVTLRAATTEEAILAHCRNHLEAHKIPRRVEIRSELPRGNTAKVQLRPEDVRL